MMKSYRDYSVIQRLVDLACADQRFAGSSCCLVCVVHLHLRSLSRTSVPHPVCLLPTHSALPTLSSAALAGSPPSPTAHSVAVCKKACVGGAGGWVDVSTLLAWEREGRGVLSTPGMSFRPKRLSNSSFLQISQHQKGYAEKQKGLKFVTPHSKGHCTFVFLVLKMAPPRLSASHSTEPGLLLVSTVI